MHKTILNNFDYKFTIKQYNIRTIAQIKSTESAWQKLLELLKSPIDSFENPYPIFVNICLTMLFLD